LSRLTPREQYDRAYRFKIASHSSLTHKPLPKKQWVSASEVCLLSFVSLLDNSDLSDAGQTILETPC
jgi:hypothetical protein